MLALRKVMIAILLMAFAAVPGVAKNYVSWKGGFYVTYPDHWKQIDYPTVDAFLVASQATGPVLDYEAVLADSSTRPFFSGHYVILTVDTIPGLTELQIDSILIELATTFGQNIKYSPVADFLADLRSDYPTYDSERKLFTVASDIVERGEVVKKSLLMMQCYDDGIASFYFYSPDSIFEQGRSMLNDIVASFSTDDIESALPVEEVKVADIEPSADSESQSSSKVYLYLGVALLLLLIVARRRFKKA